MKPNPSKILLGLDLKELSQLVEQAGEPTYRARQLFQALYGERVEAVDDLTTLPTTFREALTAEGRVIGLPKIENKFVSTDGTVRYLMSFPDAQSVETVWMPEGDGGEAGDGSEDEAADGSEDEAAGDGAMAGEAPTQRHSWSRASICVSSQVGCAVDCQFCLTALLGVKRNLSAGEIVGQVSAVLKDNQAVPRQDRINLVFMGQGEPFLNYDNFIKAVRLLVEGVGIPASRMTVSTSGIVPRIQDFAAEAIRPRLAISLNAPNDEIRTRIMPINRKWNLSMLMEAAREYPLKSREVVTFEYVMLGGVNDSLENAREVLQLIRGIKAKVNLIAWNPGPEKCAALKDMLPDGYLQFVCIEAALIETPVMLTTGESWLGTQRLIA